MGIKKIILIKSGGFYMTSESKKKFRVPHTYVILFSMIIIPWYLMLIIRSMM